MEKERVCDESRMEEWTFENADMSDAVMHRAKNYVDNWDEMKRNHIGCLFWGPVGTGKSYVAGCIANELLKQEVTVRLELSEVRQGAYVAKMKLPLWTAANVSCSYEGYAPSFSEKYDITKHPNYKYLSDYDQKEYV